MTNIFAGFTGYAELMNGDGSVGDPYKGNGTKVRFASCSLNATQEIEAPEMVMGDNTHDAWAYGKIEVGGAISGPVTESLGAFLTGFKSTIGVKYYSGFSRIFKGCVIQSFSFSVTAGDIVQFTLNIIGTGFEIGGPNSTFTKGEKIVTWDKAVLQIGPLTEDEDLTVPVLSAFPGLQSFTIEASNNVTRQFVISESSLFGDLVFGMKSVTGSVTSYTLGSSAGYGSGEYFWDAYEGDEAYPLSFSAGNFTVSTAVRFHRGTTDLSPGPVVTTVGFTGVTTNGYGAIN
jgi:hypothetical protein